MTLDEARQWLAHSRELTWEFPSSFGRPVSWKADKRREELRDQREQFAKAVRAFIHVGDLQAASEIAVNSWRLWVWGRDIAGGRSFLAEVLGGAGPKDARAKALLLYGDGLLAIRQGNLEDSRRRNQEALKAAEASGDSEALALAHLGLCRVFFNDGNHALALKHATEARSHAKPLVPAMGQAPLHMHAQSRWLAENLDEAARLFAESLSLNEKIGDDGMLGVELHNLGQVEARRGNADAAERHFRECERREPSPDEYGKALRQLNAATVAYARRDEALSRQLLERAEAILRKEGIDPAADDEFKWLRARLARPDNIRTTSSPR